MARTVFISDRDKLIKQVQKILVSYESDQCSEEVLREIGEWLEKQPSMPSLIGAKAAAARCGLKPPGVAKLRDQGRMPDPVKVIGTYDVYLESEVDALAKVLGAEREARRERREAAEAAKTNGGN